MVQGPHKIQLLAPPSCPDERRFFCVMQGNVALGAVGLNSLLHGLERGLNAQKD